MSKQIKQMQMDSLRQTFENVQDMVLLNLVGVDAQNDNHLRLALRKKGIRLQLVKNSLTRRVFDELGVKLTSPWEGQTVVAWGPDSVALLSKELAAATKKIKQVKFKAAITEKQEITFDAALQMPTRTEAIGLIISAILGPASSIASQLIAPASQIASQIQKISEKTEGEPEAPAPVSA